MNRKSVPQVAVVVIVLATALAMSAPLLVQAANELAGMTMLCENEYLELYLDETTAEVAARDKASDAVWRTSPLNDKKNAAKAQVSIRFFAPGSVESTMDSYNDSVALGQFQIEQIENGIRVDYTIGRQYDENILMPGLISAHRVEEILARIDNDSVRKNLGQLIDTYYVAMTLVPLGSDEEKTTYSESLRVFNGYRLEVEGVSLNATRTNEILRNLLGIIMGGRLEYKQITDVRADDFAQIVGRKTYILDNKTPDFMKQRISQAFQDAGYTLEDRAQDNIENNLDPPRERLEVFNVSLEYVLDGDNLVVRLPIDRVQFPDKVVDVEGKYGPKDRIISLPISSIRVLPFFGAADSATQGYILVPDGSGALIYLNSGKTAASVYTSPVYGLNPALNQLAEKVTNTMQVHLPVYGMKQADTAFLAIITGADALATIEASIASASGTYNTVGARFAVRPATTLSLQSDWTYSPQIAYGMLGKMSVLQSRMATEDIEIRYIFLHGDDADYVGMANAYRDHLIENGVGATSRGGFAGSAPFFVDFLGAVLKKANILGIPRSVPVPLTTYEQAAIIAQELQYAGVDNLVIGYSGWFNGGAKHDFPDHVSLIDSLGGRSGFAELRDRARSNGWELYPDVAFVNVYRDKLFDGFSARSDSARTIDRKIARSLVFDVPTFVAVESESGYILSPSKLPRVIGEFISDYQKLGVGGLSLRDLGRDLSADFRDDPNRLVDRAQAQKLVTEQLAVIAEQMSDGLMVRGANAYAFLFAKYVVDVPSASSEYDIIDESVPFYQIAIHGLVDFAGEPINLASDPVEALLKTVEYGADVYFEWMYAKPSSIKDTDHEEYYSLHYRDWFDTAVQLYRDAGPILSRVRTQAIVDHARLAEGVYRTQYEDGCAVIVNYNSDPVTVDGLTVDGLGFLLIEGGPAQ